MAGSSIAATILLVSLAGRVCDGGMCFSATANFVGSGVLGALGVATLMKVEHRRELMFAGLPLMFAVHQFTEGFVWLGVDGRLSRAAEHGWAAAFMLYAQGLLPVLMPLSVYLFEPNGKGRKRMVPFLVLGAVTSLYMLWALTAYPFTVGVCRETAWCMWIRRRIIRGWRRSTWWLRAGRCSSRGSGRW